MGNNGHIIQGHSNQGIQRLDLTLECIKVGRLQSARFPATTLTVANVSPAATASSSQPNFKNNSVLYGVSVPVAAWGTQPFTSSGPAAGATTITRQLSSNNSLDVSTGSGATISNGSVRCWEQS